MEIIFDYFTPPRQVIHTVTIVKWFKLFTSYSSKSMNDRINGSAFVFHSIHPDWMHEYHF